MAHRLGPVTKFALSMTWVTTTLVAVTYYQQRNHKINLVVGLDGPLVSIRPRNTYQDRDCEYDPAFNITSGGQKYSVWVRPYASFMFIVLQPFCNFYMYTCTGQDMADKVLDNVKWSDKFIERRYGNGNSHRIYDENNCMSQEPCSVRPSSMSGGNVILLITSESELFQNQNNISYPYEFTQIPRYNENESYDWELVRFTGKMIYRFFI